MVECEFVDFLGTICELIDTFPTSQQLRGQSYIANAQPYLR